ncbi:RDD family protein [Peribacillus butanolivorans]|uniref:RDD family protein n=1 Tax=Peribacillus butanolivorans TaxID=421767 RepID=UPI003D2927A4
MNSIDFLYYLIIPVVWAGFTVGKRAVNIQIVRINGKKIGFGTTLKRYILAGLVYGVTLGIGLLVFSLPFYSQLQPPYEMFPPECT